MIGALLLIAPLAAAFAAPAQEAPAAEPAAPAQEAPAAEPSALAPGEVARIDGTLSLTVGELDRYLGETYARLPEGVAALEQLLAEALIERAAEEAGLTASEAEVDAAWQSLESQARAATGGEQGLAESLGEGVSDEDVGRAMRLMVLHEKVVRRAEGLPAPAPLANERLAAWLARAVADAALVEAPLDEPLAATHRGGSIAKHEVGRRLRSSLPRDELHGVLTEMIGIVLVRRRAAELGVQVTPAAATREVLERDQRLRALAGTDEVTYDRFVQATEKRSLAELLVSDRFSTEVLIRLLTEREWDEAAARAYWAGHREEFAAESGGGGAPEDAGGSEAEDSGPPAPPPPPLPPAPPAPGEAPPLTAEDEAAWQAERFAVLKALRQRTYRRLFEDSTILRAF